MVLKIQEKITEIEVFMKFDKKLNTYERTLGQDLDLITTTFLPHLSNDQLLIAHIITYAMTITIELSMIRDLQAFTKAIKHKMRNNERKNG